MRQIYSYPLYLGTALDARDLRRLYEMQIAAVVDLALEEPPAQLGRDITYCRYPLIDGGGNPRYLLQAAVETVALLVKNSVPTLVACGAGMSRSPAVVAVALAIAEGIPPDESLQKLCDGQPHDVSLPLWSDLRQLVF